MIRLLRILERAIGGKPIVKWIFQYFHLCLKMKLSFLFLLVFKTMICDCIQQYIIMPGLLSSFLNFSRNFIPILIVLPDLDINKALMQLRSHLSELGLSIRIYGRRKLSNYENLLNRLFLFYKDFYDARDEFEKDIWDVRNIPGAKFPDHDSRHILNFEDVPIPFRPLQKDI